MLRRLVLLAIGLLASQLAVSCRGAVDDFSPDTIISMERAALDRWGKGDPEGYLAIMAPEITYFDPTLDTRIDGSDAVRSLVAPYAGKISIDRAEMLNPKVQREGDLAVLTFNLISHGAQFGGSPKGDARWNSTEIYRRIDGAWKIIHSHWSYTKPAPTLPTS